MLSLQNLTLHKGDFRIEGLSLKINKGDYCVLLGRTGAGKSRLLEAIAGISVLQSGRIFLEGYEITKLPPHRRRIGFVYQDYALFPNMTVEENIHFPLRFGSDTTEGLFDELVEFLEIRPLLGRRIDELSGGERQRVALARSLMAAPRLLLLDEPLSAIDPSLRNSVMRSLRKLQRRYGLTILHVTHNFREAAYLADTIAILDRGRLLRHGPAGEVLRRPRSLEEAKFLGFKNILDARLLGRNSGYASVNPLAVQLAEEKPACGHCFEGTVDEILGSGEHYKIFMETEKFRLFVKLPRHRVDAGLLKPGKRLHLGFDDEDVLYFGEEENYGA